MQSIGKSTEARAEVLEIVSSTLKPEQNPGKAMLHGKGCLIEYVFFHGGVHPSQGNAVGREIAGKYLHLAFLPPPIPFWYLSLATSARREKAGMAVSVESVQASLPGHRVGRRRVQSRSEGTMGGNQKTSPSLCLRFLTVFYLRNNWYPQPRARIVLLVMVSGPF